ncbi:hypothetical protein [Paraclostridium sordellii]|uniref:hypothetical protein n=1 Tax=Paraclostridium sordellii TaxID=1505 RepID=UPI0005DAEE4A|nr:hypothetical protein [Paeniclostridium sordellii]MCR1847942.1 hypothetical protein [Paeniclostridium sordellii]CEN93695.1 Uncharacterised protein [[Clostridium] sordellii] [Paeniclostridium sordellii]CEN95123.1 Uncharacterised protein [[Clostridium] sordellii] [Paeniclostridium sordellii]
MKLEFLKAIHNKKIVNIKFNSKEKGLVVRKCIPFDFGPSRRYKDNLDRYHFYDLDSPSGRHNLSILPNQLIEIEILDECFEPGDYVSWKTNWFIARDWGKFS